MRAFSALCLGSWGLLAGAYALAQAPAASQNFSDRSFRIKALENEVTQKCLKSPVTLDAPLEVDSWELICPLPEFIEMAKHHKSPALRLLTLRLIHQEIVKTRQQLVAPASKGQKANLNFVEGLSLFKNILGSKTNLQALPNFEAIASKLKEETKALVTAAQALTENPPAVLANEFALEKVDILGDALLFEELVEYLNTNPDLVSRSWLQNELINRCDRWITQFAATPLRPWLLEQFIKLRPVEITGAKDKELYYWLRSLELQSKETIQKDKNEILQQLRALWIVAVSNEDMQRIRATAETVGLSRQFSPPGTRQLNFDETMLRARAQIRKLDSPGASRTMKRIFAFNADTLTEKQIWEAFQLHIRIFRLMDAREHIPDTIQRYLDWAPLVVLEKDAPDLPSQFFRALDLARQYWTYADPNKALEVLEKIIHLNRSWNSSYQLGEALYLRARIAEQLMNKDAALPFFEEALKVALPNDMKTDLYWRYFYLHFEKSAKSGNITALFPILDRIKKELSSQDEGRLLFWQGASFTLSVNKEANKKAAIRQFKRAYEYEPFSYYSNMAALELAQLGQEVPKWKLKIPDNFAPETPDWNEFMDSDGEPRNAAYRDLVRVYHLATLGDRALAEKAYYDLDRSMWNFLLSKKVKEQSKRKYGRAVAWLRYSLGDALGGLRAAELLRSVFRSRLESSDHVFMYPLPYWEKIQNFSSKHKLDPWLAASLIRQESAFNPRARSGANAMGLMQMIPPVALAEAKLLKIPSFDVEEGLYDPKVAINLGTHHLSNLVNSCGGSWICAVASYNAGAPPVKKWLSFYPASFPMIFIERISYSETRNYVKAILRNFINYQRIYGESDISRSALLSMPQVDLNKISSDSQESAKAEPADEA